MAAVLYSQPGRPVDGEYLIDIVNQSNISNQDLGYNLLGEICVGHGDLDG